MDQILLVSILQTSKWNDTYPCGLSPVFNILVMATRSSHSHKFHTIFANKNTYKYSFSGYNSRMEQLTI